MTRKEKPIFETIFRLKALLEHLEELLIVDEHEKALEPQGFYRGNVSGQLFPVKKKRGRPPSKKSKK